LAKAHNFVRLYTSNSELLNKLSFWVSGEATKLSAADCNRCIKKWKICTECGLLKYGRSTFDPSIQGKYNYPWGSPIDDVTDCSEYLIGKILR
jgi:hypothetical protein